MSLAVVLCFYGCESPIGIAPDGALDDVFDITVLDTFSIRTYTEIEDSIVTSSPPKLLTGAASFSETGTVYAQSFLNLRPTSTLDIDQTSTNYDSLYLYLYFNEALTQKEEVRSYTVHLIKPINTEEFESSYYNFDSFPFNEEPIGSFEYLPTMETGDSIPVKISGGLGERLFSLALQGQISSGNETFLSQFTGFVIRPSDTNTDQVISLLNTTYSSENIVEGTVSKLRIYFHQEEDYTTPEYYDFYNSTAHTTFNNISIELGGTSLASINSGRIPAEQSENLSFVQAGAGIYTRIDLPYILSLNELSKNYVFNSAILEVTPLSGSYADSNPLPDSLAVFITNELSTTGDFNYNDSGAEQYYIYSGLDYDEELGESATYSFDITDILHLQLEDNGAHDYSLILTPPTETVLTTFDQVQIPGASHTAAGVRLKIYITKVLTDYD